MLIDALIANLLAQDSLDKAKKMAGLDPAKHKHIATFNDFVGKIGISGFEMQVGDDSNVKWRTSTGELCNVIVILCTQADVQHRPSLLLLSKPTSKVVTMQSLWLELLHINQLLGKPVLNDHDITEFESTVKAWVEKFCSIYQKRKVACHAQSCWPVLVTAWRAAAIHSA